MPQRSLWGHNDPDPALEFPIHTSAFRVFLRQNRETRFDPRSTRDDPLARCLSALFPNDLICVGFVTWSRSGHAGILPGWAADFQKVIHASGPVVTGDEALRTMDYVLEARATFGRHATRIVFNAPKS